MDKISKTFLFLVCLYTALLFLVMVVEDRVALLGNIQILSGTLVIPLIYPMGDIITEVYGYKKARMVIWLSLAVLLICSLLIIFVLCFPADQSVARNSAYQIVLPTIPKNIITYSIASILSAFVNSYAISKLKILVRGKYFWLRSLLSTAVGEALFIFTWGILGFYTEFPFALLLHFMLISYISKLIYNILLITPVSIITTILKKKEKMDVYDYHVNFNPFSLKT